MCQLCVSVLEVETRTLPVERLGPSTGRTDGSAWEPRPRGRVEPPLEGVLRGEDDGLARAIVQPRQTAARRGRDDRKRPERLGLACPFSTSDQF